MTHRVTGLFAPEREADLRDVLQKLPDVKLVRVNLEHGEATFSYDPAVAFKDTKPEKIIERFDEKLRSASSSTFGVRPLSATPKEQLTSLEIPVAGLDCKACALTAYESVYKIPGVMQAIVSFKEGRVTALIDKTRTERAALIDALKKQNVAVKTTAEEVGAATR